MLKMSRTDGTHIHGPSTNKMMPSEDKENIDDAASSDSSEESISMRIALALTAGNKSSQKRKTSLNQKYNNNYLNSEIIDLTLDTDDRGSCDETFPSCKGHNLLAQSRQKANKTESIRLSQKEAINRESTHITHRNIKRPLTQRNEMFNPGPSKKPKKSTYLSDVTLATLPITIDDDNMTFERRRDTQDINDVCNTFEELTAKMLALDKSTNDVLNVSNKQVTQDINDKCITFEELTAKMLALDTGKKDALNVSTVKEADKHVTKDINDDDITFEELMEKMLTPDPRKDNAQNMSEELTAKILAPDTRKNDVLKVSTVKEANKQMSKDINDDDITFEELMEKMLTPDSRKDDAQNVSQVKTIKKQMIKDINVDNVTIDKLEKLLTPIIKTDIETGKNTTVEETIRNVLAANPKWLRDLMKVKPPVSEISTQTSFDESSINNLSHTHVYGPFMYSHNFNDSQRTNDSFLNNSQVSLRTGRIPTATKIPNILEILSHDITVSNGRKSYNNIVKIGTDRWLENALHLTYVTINKKYEVELMQVHNSYNLYTDSATKVTFECSNKGDVKICKIIKKGTRPNIDISYIEKRVTETTPPTERERKLRKSLDEIGQNEDLIRSCNAMKEVNKTKIQAKIHEIISQVYEVFESNKVPCLVVPSGTSRTKSSVRKLRYLVQRSRPKFCRILYLLGKIYNMLEHGDKLTKREIYYQLNRFVSNQGLVNSAIDEITGLLGVGYWDLNIVVQSGLVYGNLKIFWSSGDVTNCNAPNTLIPEDFDNIVEIHSNAYFILVVEKESMFRKLLGEDLPNKLGRPFIMLTGKGVPDMNTRRFLKKISTMLSLPVFILVDADVYGIRIMLNYRFGALSNTHLVDHLAVPNARWLGVFPSDIAKYNIPTKQMNQRDIRDIKILLTTRHLEEYPKIAKEVNCLLNSKKKASIEGLLKNNTFLSETYLPMKIYNQDFV